MKRSSIVAALSSLIAHLMVALVILALPSAARQPSYYVLAYLADNSDAGDGRGKDIGAAGASPRANTGAPATRRDTAHREAAQRHRAAPYPSREALAAERRDLFASPSPKTGEGSRNNDGVANSGSPFPFSGKGDRGLGSAGGSAGIAGVAGGSGGTEAHALYDRSPPPAYPEIARRENQQGTVLLRVLVEADGSVARVEIAQSSGFDVLDRAAADTVRFRWRFVPGASGGANVTSWVLVPIRFALRDT